MHALLRGDRRHALGLRFGRGAKSPGGDRLRLDLCRGLPLRHRSHPLHTPNPGSDFDGSSGGSDGTCICSGNCAFTAVAPITANAVFRCPVGFNDVGGTTVQHIFDFIAAWFSDAPHGDFNGSGASTVRDILDSLAAWFAGCP